MTFSLAADYISEYTNFTDKSTPKEHLQ